MTMVDEIRAIMAQERELMLQRGNALAQSFIAHQQRAKEFHPLSEWGKHTLRVRARRVVISFEWFWTEFRGLPGHREMLYHTVARGRGHRYPDTAFSRAPTWERKLIHEIEDTLEPLRRRADTLLKIEQHLKVYERIRLQGDPLASYDWPSRTLGQEDDDSDDIPF